MGRRRGGRSKKSSGSRKKGLFKPPKHKDLARIVTFTSVSAAERATRRLKKMFRTAGPKRKLLILRATQYAANRAKAGARNPKFRPETKRKWLQVSKVYEAASEWMEERYRTKR